MEAPAGAVTIASRTGRVSEPRQLTLSEASLRRGELLGPGTPCLMAPRDQGVCGTQPAEASRTGATATIEGGADETTATRRVRRRRSTGGRGSGV